MKIKFLLAAALILAGSRLECETAKITAKDGLLLECFYSISKSSPCLVLLHGYGSNKEEWLPFAALLKKHGLGYIAYDARGHGKSTDCKDGRKLDYRTFGDNSNEWQNMISDLGAVIEFLRKKGIKEKDIIPCGASMGANIVLIHSAVTGKPGKIILLSGSFNPEAVKKAAQKKIFAAAARDDNNAFNELSKYKNHFKKDNKFTFYTAEKGHGVNMFDGKTEKEIISFVLK